MPKKTHSYTTLAGEAIEYETPGRGLAAFLARVTDATADPNVSEAALTALVYGKENPLLEQSISPDYGMVTKAVFADPLYHVMTDLLARKRVAAGKLDLERAAASFTVTVTDAAEQLGVHPSAIRQAIAATKLSARKIGGTHYIDPRSIASYRVSRRGPKPRATLDVVIAHDATGGMRIKAPSLEMVRGVGSARASIREGRVVGFERVAVIFGPKGKYRLFVLEPDDKDEEVTFGMSSVRGKFRIAEKINNPAKASAAFKAFQAS
jgi:hypothetical protein